MPKAVHTTFGTFVEGQRLPSVLRSPIAALLPLTDDPATVSLDFFVNTWGLEVRVGDAMTKLLVPWDQIIAALDSP